MAKKAAPVAPKAEVRIAQDHPTRKVVIKSADVDVEMIPLVNWMNAFSTVTTLYCCQGDDDKPDSTYVLWTCTDEVDLIMVLKRLAWCSDTNIIWNEHKRHLEYSTTFHSRRLLKEVYLGPRV